MKKSIEFVSCALLSSFLVCPVSAYDHTSYDQSGLVIQYDGADNEDNGGSDVLVVNLGSGGSSFDLKPVVGNNGYNKTRVAHPDDKVADGEIRLGDCAGDYCSHGWMYSSSSSTAVGTGDGWTIEYVGAMADGQSKNGYSYVVGIDNGTDGGRLLYLASGQPSTGTIGAEAMAGGYNYEGTSFVKGADLEANNNSVLATRSVTLDATTKTVVFYENGVKVGEGTTKGSTKGGVKRINIGDMRAGRGYGWWSGSIKNIRVYSRVLSAAEIAVNYDIDGYRFYGKSSDPGQLVIANEPSGIGAPVPGAGVQSPALGASVACSAPTAFFKDGVRYVASGYTLETSDDGGETWSEPVEYVGDSYTYVNSGVTTRLTWKWIPTHYRLYVDKNGGSEEFSFTPAVDVEDPSDTATAGGYFQLGELVAVRGIPMETPVASTFTKWTGDCGETTNNPVEITMDAAKRIKASFSRPWFREGNSIVKDDWILTVSTYNGVLDGVDKPLSIAKYVSGSGELDMSSLNKDLVAAGEPPVKAIGEYAFDPKPAAVTGLVLPTEENGEGIAVISKWAFAYCPITGPVDFWSVEEIGDNAFRDVSGITGDCILPKCVSVGDRAFRSGTANQGSFKGGALVAPELSLMYEGCFAACGFTSAFLPKMTNAVKNVKYPFYSATAFTNIVLSADVDTLPPEFVYGVPSSGVLVLDFPRKRPVTDVSVWVREGVDKSKIIIHSSIVGTENWTSDEDNFVPLADVTDTPSAEVRAVRKLLGRYGGCWFSAIPQGPTSLILR